MKENVFFFFFSSRRRHTRLTCDWSSDVCSSDLRHLLEGRPAPGSLPVLLTFDDGGESAYGCVADLLERAGWRGHFLITTDFLDRPGFVTRAQVRDLAARGHEIGSHTCSHPTPMAGCRWEHLVDEWTRSTAVLADVLGAPVRLASVP